MLKNLEFNAIVTNKTVMIPAKRRACQNTSVSKDRKMDPIKRREGLLKSKDCVVNGLVIIPGSKKSHQYQNLLLTTTGSSGEKICGWKREDDS